VHPVLSSFISHFYEGVFGHLKSQNNSGAVLVLVYVIAHLEYFFFPTYEPDSSEIGKK